MFLAKRDQCFACQCTSRKHICDLDNARLIGCRQCGAQWLEGAAGHDDPSWLHDPTPPPHYAAYLQGRVRRFADYLRRLCPRPGSLLDVGCGNGDFMLEAAHLGWHVCGTELDERQAHQAATLTSLPVYPGDLADVASAVGRRFDVVTLWGVLEHVPDPVGLLVTVRRLLMPGGTVLLETPNAGGLFFLIACLLMRGMNGRIMRPMRELAGGDHIVWITPAAVGFLFQHCGLDLVDVRGSTNSVRHRFGGFSPTAMVYREGTTLLNVLGPMVGRHNQLIAAGKVAQPEVAA